MEFLPIFLDIRGRKVLVDGGEAGAARRIERALSAGAQVTAFDPEPGEEVRRHVGAERFELIERLPEKSDLEGAAVVYGASEDAGRDARLYGWTREERILCNIADSPEQCDFIAPSIVDRAPLVVAISTSGDAPVIARTLRARIEAQLPPRIGLLAAFLDGFRPRIAATILDARERRRFWEKLIDGSVGDLFLNGEVEEAERRLLEDLAAHAADAGGKSRGEVYLVGAGPGNPDLLTFRALRLMQRADVVLYDRLIGDEIMALVRRDAERINVGKAPNHHTATQEEISAMLVRLAQEGKRVLRLKGGDPFIFGRGGEEIETLAEAGVRFQVVPGITAAAGCGAYAGIPLTHRDHAQACVFATAHGKDGALDLDWEVLARPNQTLAIYMGLGNIAHLAAGLRAHGVKAETLVAVIEKGATPEQKVVTGSLANIVERVEAAALTGPAMILVGSVVSLRDKLQWNRDDDGAHQMSLTPRMPGEL